MSTATSYLYAVPPPTDPRDPSAPTDQLSRMGWLLRLRRVARQALDLALALPRQAANWALRQVQTATGIIRRTDLSGWAGRALRASATLAHEVGVVPLGLVVATAPPVQRMLTPVIGTCLRWAGTLLRRTWAATSALIARTGTPGLTILDTLDRWADRGAAVVSRITHHKVTLASLEVAQRALATVAPLARMFTLHRLLAVLIPARWVRSVVEAVVVPVVIALVAPAALLVPTTVPRPCSATPSTVDGGQHTVGKGEVQEGGPTGGESPQAHDVFGRSVPGQATAEVIADHGSQQFAQPRNRAERRAMQQEQARARRAASHRPSAS